MLLIRIMIARLSIRASKYLAKASHWLFGENAGKAGSNRSRVDD